MGHKYVVRIPEQHYHFDPAVPKRGPKLMLVLSLNRINEALDRLLLKANSNSSRSVSIEAAIFNDANISVVANNRIW